MLTSVALFYLPSPFPAPMKLSVQKEMTMINRSIIITRDPISELLRKEI